ncbi:hypothetical protein B5G52_00485 [Pseudoalteromonas sp. A601]|uniref:hypothetical protein n=1 Tax=Pseudoalteromonas sp. A601 TaxID=1967839 RepID=UPI000B3CBCA0|nr:hypothetical protein [Pseudoalteromonas sp. A601]OUS74522.1 hypothetical protein B5G52_00485 [Pseudoalteromonas sp. A601]
MEVNSNNTNLASQFISTNSEVKVNKSVNSKEQLNSEMERLAKDTYHKDQPKEPEATYDKPMTIATNHVLTSRAAEEKALTDIRFATVNLYMPGGEVSQSVEKMFTQYGNIMAEIAAEHPSVASKDWGLSISQSGELEVTGSISDKEKSLISEILNDNGDFVAAAKKFKSSMLEHIDMGVRGWSSYDVNEDNFSKTFDLKEILDNSQGTESFKQAWNKDFSWLELNDNISSQLRRNAERK